MPDRVWWLIPLIPFAALITVLWQLHQSRADEKRRLRETGSAAVTPVSDFLTRIGPTSIVWGTDEQNAKHLGESHGKWWGELRPALRIYANAHPSKEIRAAANEAVEAVQKDMAATNHLLVTRKTAETVEGFKASEQAHEDSERLVEELLQKIRDY